MLLRRTALVLAGSAAVTMLLGGTASASCVDDFGAEYPEGHTFTPSDHYLNWVHVVGTATVIVEGDDLLWDAGQLVDYTVHVAGTSGPAATVGFVDCVAG
ncbi:MAG TPA: hypothetical protein VNA20_11305 [Frankiaceae bacterium]|nr:hypothetical protein [Frankiaceae bacterium]